MHTIGLRPFLAWPRYMLQWVRPRSWPRFGGSGASAVVRAANLLLTWQERVTQRHILASLDERLRRDIGLSRADALREACKPFWRA